MIDSLNVDLFF